MTQPRFSIGIDLGTTNSAIAFVPLSEEVATEVLAVPQYDTASTVAEAATLPSFLYLPEPAVAASLKTLVPGGKSWIVGRLALRKSGETPDRVAHSAKSWLCHHAADRSAPFLPWGSDSLSLEDKISPVSASARILAHLRWAWNARFAARGADFAFDAQDITITVPASFDAAAQRLTLSAAQEAGFPMRVRLLEEPQAAFYGWLEQQSRSGLDPWAGLSDPQGGAHHILVVDIGGGTSDFSLFERSRKKAAFILRRVAVSEHILLGGDNIDLAIAHRMEPRLVKEGDKLSARQWDHLVARCRSLKEQVLGVDGAHGYYPVWPVVCRRAKKSGPQWCH
ncbi:MAG: Hsp70 family protein, partial [Alphaproteobacteria bacterium]